MRRAIRIFKLCPLKDTLVSPRWAFFREAILTGFLSPILLRKLIEVLRAGGFVREGKGSSETWDVGMVFPLGKLTSESALALCIKVIFKLNII